MTSRRSGWLAMLAVSALGVMAGPALAQRPILNSGRVFSPPANPQSFLGRGSLPANQFLFNSAVVGQAINNIPPGVRRPFFGFPDRPVLINPNPFVPFAPTLATAPAPLVNPFVPPAGSPFTGATLSTSPYSLSTDPTGLNNPYGYTGYGYQDPNGAYLAGVADLTRAAGQYFKDTQQASLIRESVRQAAIDTNRKRVEYEQWYERQRLTYNQVLAKEQTTDLDRARRFALPSEITSAQALNHLLRSIKRTAGITNLKRGPQIDLSDVSLENVHLTTLANNGNVGLLKSLDKEGRLVLYWPAGLEGAAYREAQKELSQNLGEAVASLKKGDRPAPAMIKDIEKAFKTIEAKFNDRETTAELAPSQYIEASRYVGQVGQAVRALRDPKATNFFNDTWKAQGRTVAELVDNMTKKGLEFAPSTPGDEGAYSALYEALRAFEGGLQVALNQK